MQNHTGCICLTFLHYAFSNASSNCLHQRRHSCTGCICLSFPHCALSNVFSKRLHKRMQSHTGCICLTFLHCAFSNVSSNRLPESMQNHTGCIFLLFSIVYFKMCPQIACPKRCIVTLVTFVWLSPVVCLSHSNFNIAFIWILLFKILIQDWQSMSCLGKHHNP